MVERKNFALPLSESNFVSAWLKDRFILFYSLEIELVVFSDVYYNAVLLIVAIIKFGSLETYFKFLCF